MAQLCPGLLYSFIWLLVLLFIMWPIAGFLAGFYILFLPFQPCFSFLKDINTTLLKWMQYCERVGQYIKDMHPLNCN